MNRTEAAIMEAFLQLLETKPYNKITVKNIVEKCQVNRNTFYYYFQDIPDLMEHVMKSRVDYIIRNYCSFNSPIDYIVPLSKDAMKFKKSILNVYRSVQREEFLNNLEQVAFYIVNRYINAVTEKSLISDEDKNMLIRLFKCILVGIAIDWLDSGMSYDLPNVFIRICNLLSISGKHDFINSSDLKL